MEKKDEQSSSPGWRASLFLQTRSEDVAAAASPTILSPRPSVVYSSKDESGSPLQRLQLHVSKMLKGISSPPEVKSGLYNPEILTSLKRQWATEQLHSLDQREWKEPSKLFESMVVVGLPPNSDIRALQNMYSAKKFDGSERSRMALGDQLPAVEPQVLFVYPPEKQLPLKYKDLLSFCFPAGVEVNAIERTPSMSELNEILLGQEHLKQSDLSFVFRLQVADDSTLYGCCVLVEEIVQKPSGLISVISDGHSLSFNRSRHILTTRRCYCILSRLPFFELHFGVLNSIFTEERLQRLTKQIGYLDLEPYDGYDDVVEVVDEKAGCLSVEDGEVNLEGQNVEDSKSNRSDSMSVRAMDGKSHFEHKEDSSKKEPNNSNEVPLDTETDNVASGGESPPNASFLVDFTDKKQTALRRSPNTVLPLLRFQQCDSPESSSSFQGSPSEGRHFRSDDVDEEEAEEASSSGQDSFREHRDILVWAKANNHGSLQIISEYYQLCYPTHGSTINFHPLDHQHPLQYHRPDETVLRVAGSTVDLNSCTTSLELAEAHNALMVEEEATALSVWAVSCLCGSLRLEHILTLFAGALLEKQIVVVCSNLGILSALVLSIIPLIRPYQWQSLLMPVLPNDMLDFLDAPVPYIVGVNSRTSEVQSKLANSILVDANRNQLKSPRIPQLPQQRELYSRLGPYHEKLVGESYLGKKRPVYECNDVQVEAAKGFLGELRSYLDSLCSNLRSHTITNVQSNDDKVSLLLKESFIESFPSRDRSFMKLFLDTQLFSVHTDFVLSFFQKE